MVCGMGQSTERFHHVRSAATTIAAAVLAAFGVWTFFFDESAAFARDAPGSETERVAATDLYSDVDETTAAGPTDGDSPVTG